MTHQIQTIGFQRIPREEWKNQVGKVVMYATNADMASATGKRVYYNGILATMDDREATFTHSTWYEPEFDKKYGRKTRTLAVDDIFEMIPSALEPSDQEEDFSRALPFN